MIGWLKMLFDRFGEPAQSEQEFCGLIDANFPYREPAAAFRAIKTASSISPNAMFAVLEEICRPPFGSNVAEAKLLALLSMWRKSATHPLANDISDCARRMIEGSFLSAPDARSLMEKIAAFPGMYAALNIAYFSCDDAAGENEATYETIRKAWDDASDSRYK